MTMKGASSEASFAIYGLLVQLVERLTVNQDVGGSSPSQTASGTKHDGEFMRMSVYT